MFEIGNWAILYAELMDKWVWFHCDLTDKERMIELLNVLSFFGSGNYSLDNWEE